MRREQAPVIPLAIIAFLPLACSKAGKETSVDGTYDTVVSVVSATEGCSLPVQNNPTVVQTSNGNTVVTLRHAGTTYGGALKPDLSFTTEPRVVDVNGVSYAIVVAGKFAEGSLDANVTLDYGTAPACHVVVHWAGSKQQ